MSIAGEYARFHGSDLVGCGNVLKRENWFTSTIVTGRCTIDIEQAHGQMVECFPSHRMMQSTTTSVLTASWSWE